MQRSYKPDESQDTQKSSVRYVRPVSEIYAAKPKFVQISNDAYIAPRLWQLFLDVRR